MSSRGIQAYFIAKLASLKVGTWKENEEVNSWEFERKLSGPNRLPERG